MIAVLLRGKCAVLLALAACQPVSEGAGQADDARLAAIEAKLDTVTTKLDAVATKLDATTSSLEELAAEATARKARSDALEARRLAREEDREQRGRRDLADPFGLPSELTGPREIEGAAAGIECEGLESTAVSCQIDRALLDQIMADPAVLAKQARVVPHVRDGVVYGYKLYGIRRGSLPKLLGMQNGDAITGVDGKSLDSLEAVMDIYAALRDGRKGVVLDVERRGASMTVTVEIVE